MHETETGTRVRIYGRVQGVWFRGWTERQATALGLRGWVRNRLDGSVEAVFAGPGDRVAAMIEACHAGPSAARVDRVDAEPLASEALSALTATFEQRSTE